jgi:hypothetical protein
MRAQVILRGGPLDLDMIPVNSEKDGWPTEIRVASGDVKDGKDNAYCYALETIERVGPAWFGAYTFVGNKLTAQTLLYTKE